MRQSCGPQVPAESLQSQQRFKHERPWKDILGVSHTVNLFIWNNWAGFTAADVSQMSQGSKEGHEGTGLILLIFWGRTDDRRTDSSRGSVQMPVKKKTNLQILCYHRQHTFTPTHRQSKASWVDCVRFPHFWQHLSDFTLSFSLFFGQLAMVYQRKFSAIGNNETLPGNPPPPHPTPPISVVSCKVISACIS